MARPRTAAGPLTTAAPRFGERFDVEAFAGAGSFGSVWRVRDRWTDQVRAAKLLTDRSDDAAWRQRFFHEFALLFRLRHPGLIRAYDYGHTEDGAPFFTMDWHDGPTLEEQPPDPAHRTRILWELADTLAFIHGQDLIHADIKTANIKLRPNLLTAPLDPDGDRALTLLDFGLAVERLPEEDARRGTVHYMAPEWFTPGGIDHRVDLYSLGILIFELCAGRLPYDADDPLIIIQKHMEAEPPSLAEAAPDTAPAIAEAVARLLAKQPEIRDRGWTLLCEFVATETGRDPGRGPSALRAHRTSLGDHARHVPTELVDSWLSESDRRRVFYVRGGLGLDHEYTLEALVPEVHRYGFVPWRVDDPDDARLDLGGSTEPKLAALIYVTGATADQFAQYIERWLASSHGPAQLAVTLDTDQPENQSLATTLGRLVRENAVYQIAVGCNDDGRAHRLQRQVLGDRLDAEARQDLVRRACGNPARLEALIRDVLRAGPGSTSLDAILSESGAFALVLERERDTLRRAHVAEELLAQSLLAVARCPVDRQVLRSLADIAWASALSRWLDLGRVQSETGCFVWKRPDLADALLSMLPEPRRRILHRAWAEYWSSFSPEPGSDEHEYLVYHSLRSDAYRRAVRVGLESVRYWTARHQAHRALDTLEVVRLCLAKVEQPPPSWTYELAIATADARRVLARYAEAKESLQKVLKDPAISGQPRWEADIYKRIGDLCKSLKQPDEGEAVLHLALERYRDLDDRAEISHVLNNLGNIHYIGGDLDAALACYEEALELQRQLDLTREIASTLNNIGGLMVLRSQYARAVERLTEAVSIKRTLDDPEELARSLNNLAVAYVETGKFALAWDTLSESYALNVGSGKTGEQLFNLENMALVAMARGEWADAMARCETGLRLCDNADSSESRAPFLLVMSGVALAQGNYDIVLTTHKEAERLLASLEDPDLRLWQKNFAAEWALWRNRPAEVMARTTETIDIAQEEDLPAWITRSQIQRARGALMTDPRDANAVRWLHRSLDLAEQTGALPEQIKARVLLAELEVREGRLEYAQDHLRRCEAMLLDCGAKPLFLPFSHALGSFYQKRGDLEMALSVFETARKLSTGLAVPEWTWRFLAQTGHLLVELRRHDEAVSQYRGGLEILTHLVERLPDEDRDGYMQDHEKIALEQGLRSCRDTLVS